MAGRKGDSSGNLIFGPKVECRRGGLHAVTLNINEFVCISLFWFAAEDAGF
jgi:hypothetical protein